MNGEAPLRIFNDDDDDNDGDDESDDDENCDVNITCNVNNDVIMIMK